MTALRFFRRLVQGQKGGAPLGVTSVCSASPMVLRAALTQAAAEGRPALIESTVNQVNQFGGYTGLTPEGFRLLLEETGAQAGLPPVKLLLGADHLGPYPWRGEAAGEAMAKACALAADCIRAGYRKIHLDASMPLKSDRLREGGGIPAQLAAEREAALAEAAEKAFADSRRGPGDDPPVYVIGTDVPPPGGALDEEGLHITRVEELRETVDACRRAFEARALDGAWERVVAVVVQPGVEFGDHTIHPYRRERARALCGAARGLPGMILEGHSTDYQSRAGLRQLVEDGVGILKVGPALSFAMREALFALEHIEAELCRGRPGRPRSALGEELEAVMLANPAHWQGYYQGDEEERRLARRFSLLDRCRYYWAAPRVEAALRRLLANLEEEPIPLTLVSQYFPHFLPALREGRLAAKPRALVEASIRRVLDDYSQATTG